MGALAAVFLHAAWRSWLRWGDLIVDSGRDWAWALELARGKRLYVDLNYHHGPLAPYLNAALLRLFGERLEPLLGMGLLLAAAAAALLYRLARRGLGPWGACLASAAFLYDCAFGGLRGYGSYNFVLPYGWAATYGLVAALASLDALLGWREKGGTARVAASAALLGITALTKVELTFALAATHAYVWWLERPAGVRRKAALASYGAAAAVVAAAYAYFARGAGADVLLGENLLRLHNLWGATPLKTAGLVVLPRALLDAAAALGCAALAVALASRLLRARANALAWTLAGAAAAAAAARWLGVHRQFQGLAALLGGMLLWGHWSGWVPPSFRGFAPVLLFGLLLLGRILLNTGAHHYGFYLLPAALAGYHYWFWELAPWLANRCAQPPARALAAYRAAAAAGLVALLLLHARETGTRLERRTVPVEGPRGRLLVEAGNRGEALAETVRHLARTLAKDEAVVALPEGAGIGFLAGARHPVRIDTFLPRDIGTPERDREAVLLLDRSRPRRVLLVPRDTSEFGTGAFGKGYGFELAEYLRTRYALERMVEAADAPGPAHRIAILRRLGD